MSGYEIQRTPFIVPTTDGKWIEEHFGQASKGDRDLSLARMVAPPGWSEPFQTARFDEYTLVIRGRKMVEIGEERIVLEKGSSILVRQGTRVRYSNPFGDETEYVSLCVPAFSPERVHREI